jgi:hypothetical protein
MARVPELGHHGAGSSRSSYDFPVFRPTGVPAHRLPTLLVIANRSDGAFGLVGSRAQAAIEGETIKLLRLIETPIFEGEMLRAIAALRIIPPQLASAFGQFESLEDLIHRVSAAAERVSMPSVPVGADGSSA